MAARPTTTPRPGPALMEARTRNETVGPRWDGVWMTEPPRDLPATPRRSCSARTPSAHICSSQRDWRACGAFPGTTAATVRTADLKDEEHTSAHRNAARGRGRRRPRMGHERDSHTARGRAFEPRPANTPISPLPSAGARNARRHRPDPPGPGRNGTPPAARTGRRRCVPDPAGRHRQQPGRVRPSLQCRAKNTGPRPRTAAADLPMCPGQA
jgi:hypothetical protein